jgi:hypothetical protein
MKAILHLINVTLAAVLLLIAVLVFYVIVYPGMWWIDIMIRTSNWVKGLGWINTTFDPKLSSLLHGKAD